MEIRMIYTAPLCNDRALIGPSLCYLGTKNKHNLESLVIPIYASGADFRNQVDRLQSVLVPML